MSGQAGALYAQSATTLTNSMADIGEHLAARCAALQRNPTARECEDLAINLDGARRAVLRLREQLIAEGAGDGR